VPEPTAARIATMRGHSACTNPTARTAAASPETEPTDRSISPSSSTTTMPRAIVPIEAHCIVRFTRLVLDRKTGLSVWKTPQMTTSPAITGRGPRSPPRMRSAIS
jgi:hypothetical protein